MNINDVMSMISSKKGYVMLFKWILLFFLVAMAASIVGFRDISQTAVLIAKILFFVFLVIAIKSFLF